MNKGYDSKEIERVKSLCKKAGHLYVENKDEDNDEFFQHIYFIGQNEGKEVVYDAFVFTLETDYVLNLSDAAEAITLERFPKYRGKDFDALDGEHIEVLEDIMEEIAHQDEYKVQEFYEMDKDHGYGIRIDICMNWEEITPSRVDQFIEAFNAGTIKLDETYYSFDAS